MRSHPLYNRVQRIIVKSAVNGSVAHSNFARIRNQASVRAILTYMRYKPSCPTRPYMWTHDSIKPKQKQKRVVLTERQIFMNNIKAGNEVYVKEVALTRTQIRAAIGALRSSGLEIKSVRGEHGLHIVSYQLIEAQ